jgi:hypothetical protein
MNLLCSVAAFMVAVAIVSRLLWWASERSHRLASQRQNSTENHSELCKTDHGIQVNGKAPSEVESQNQERGREQTS